MSIDFLLSDEDKPVKPKDGFNLIDLSQIALATVMNNTSDDEKSKLTIPFIRHLILTTLKTNILLGRKTGHTVPVICVDNGKDGYWRRDFASYYKRNRLKAREESTFDWEGYFTALAIVVDELQKYMPYIVLNIKKAEADDCIAVLTKYAALNGIPVRITSSDGDFTPLHKYKNVVQWSPMQKKYVKSKTGDPELDSLIKVMKGDRKDGVSGIRVRSDFYVTMVEGERSPPISTKLINQVLEVKDNDEEIAKILTKEQFERFKENRVLIDFDYINEDIAASIQQCYDNYTLPPRKLIYTYFVKSGLSKLLNNINDF